jgi:hypothetical protein
MVDLAALILVAAEEKADSSQPLGITTLFVFGYALMK